jgi:hypothetical protein
MSSFELTRYSTRPMKSVNVAPQDAARNCVSWKVQLPQDAADMSCTDSIESFILVPYGNYPQCEEPRGRLGLADLRVAHLHYAVIGEVAGSRPDEVNVFIKNGVFWDVTPCSSCKN